MAGEASVQPACLPIEGSAAGTTHRTESDDYSKPREVFSALGQKERQRLYNNISSSMRDIPEAVVERQVAEFSRIDPAYAAGVLAAVMRAKRSANSESLRRWAGPQPISRAAE